MASKTEERPHKKARLFGSLEHIVTLVVGRNEDAIFTIHQNILCKASPFFEAACKSEWMKPDDRIIKLPEDNKAAIQAMVYWMYHDEIYVSRRIFEDKDDFGGEEGVMNTAQGLFAKLYVLGDKYQIPRLQNDAIDAMLDWKHDMLDLRIVPYIYNNTLSKYSPFRRLLVKMASWETDFGDFDVANCHGFWLDVIDTFTAERGCCLGMKEVNLVLQNPGNDFCEDWHVHDKTNSTKCKKPKKPYIEEEEDEENLTS